MKRSLRLLMWFFVFATVSLELGGVDLCLGEAGGVHPFQDVLGVLAQAPTGKLLIQRALKAWGAQASSELADHFQWADSSRTDTVLTRHFNVKSGKEERDRDVKIFLREGQPSLELVLDLAHELVHATARPSFDPYDAALTPGKYILTAIEGEGGEVEDVLTECAVAIELSDRLRVPVPRCDSYRSTGAHLNRDRVLHDFYNVGSGWSELSKRLGAELSLFPLLSNHPPLLYSSTGHAPYPIALLREFDGITEIACRNSKNRLQGESLFESTGENTGEKAGVSAVQNFLNRRCHL